MVKNFYKKYFTIVLIVLSIVLINRYLAGNFLQNVFYKIIVGPGIFLNERISFIRRISSSFLRSRQITEEIVKISEENNILRGESAELENLRRENQFLRDQLGASRRLDAELVIAQIFHIEHGAASSTALINKGTKDGVEKHAPLIAAGDILVGLVDEVFDETARVLLLDDSRVKVSGRIQSSKILTDVIGELGEKLQLGLISVNDEVKEGDLVITSGLDGLPEALLVAKIIKVETPSGALFKTVTAQTLFDPSLGSGLFVILR